MPTDRFYRLPAGKSEAIRQAAVREFARVRPEEVSINRIVRDAGISRGSFYTYFRDKYDLLKWLIGGRIKEHQDSYYACFREVHGDIWALLDWAFPYGINQMQNDGFMDIFGNILESSLFSNFIKGAGEEETEANEQVQNYLGQMYGLLDQKKYPMSWQMFYDLMEIQGMVYMRAMKSLLRDKVPMEQAVENYKRLIKILRHGAGPEADRQNNRQRQEETKQV